MPQPHTLPTIYAPFTAVHRRCCSCLKGSGQWTMKQGFGARKALNSVTMRLCGCPIFGIGPVFCFYGVQKEFNVFENTLKLLKITHWSSLWELTVSPVVTQTQHGFKKVLSYRAVTVSEKWSSGDHQSCGGFNIPQPSFTGCSILSL